jgi:hypothetical protein
MAQQPPADKWEIEFHGGGALVTNPTGGTTSMPDPGAAFSTFNARPSRRVSSWYFGDGALLLNQVFSNSALVTQRITPLDPVVNSPLTREQPGGSFGVRVGRVISSRLTAAFSVDYSLGKLEMTGASLAGIEASRASYSQMWNAILASPAFVRQTVSSTASIHTVQGHQILMTGTLDINLKTQGSVIPYVTVGAGVISNIGDAPSATLAGNYQFLFGGSPMSETDTLTVRDSRANAFVGLVGGGVRYYVSPRWGVRFEVREHVSKNTGNTLVDASALVGTLTPTNVAASAFGNPAIQWSNNRSTGQFSSLSGPPIDGFRTFTGRGLQSHAAITVGVFMRF